MATKEHIQEKLERLKQSLLSKALSDGQISSEERMILNSINYDIDNLYDTLEEAFEDNIITSTEKSDMVSLVDRICNDAETTASFDEYVSKDEESLILRLKRTLVDVKKTIQDL
ncbi:MAG: hypothetical protein GPJ54_19130 [Candidatus Heimdallarchaeota archaeon]|nr:hypothetical protein [Candidatus Heimdallarchaeota archaeon]